MLSPGTTAPFCENRDLCQTAFDLLRVDAALTVVTSGPVLSGTAPV